MDTAVPWPERPWLGTAQSTVELEARLVQAERRAARRAGGSAIFGATARVRAA